MSKKKGKHHSILKSNPKLMKLPQIGKKADIKKCVSFEDNAHVCSGNEFQLPLLNMQQGGVLSREPLITELDSISSLSEHSNYGEDSKDGVVDAKGENDEQGNETTEDKDKDNGVESSNLQLSQRRNNEWDDCAAASPSLHQLLDMLADQDASRSYRDPSKPRTQPLPSLTSHHSKSVHNDKQFSQEIRKNRELTRKQSEEGK